MALIEIKRRCEDCDRTRARMEELIGELKTLRHDVEVFRLDYQSLYEKVRFNLSKLAKRAEAPSEPEPQPEVTDPLTEYRNALLARKMARHQQSG